MDRQLLLSVYCQKRTEITAIAEISRKFPELLSEQPLTPEFVLEKQYGGDSSGHKGATDSSSISTTLSFCSNFSRVTTDQVLYRDILRKRKVHRIFLELVPAEEHGDKDWCYISDKDGRVVGPLSTEEMNRRFELNVFSERTQVKKKSEEEYYPLSRLVRRYYKTVLMEKLDMKKGPAQLSSKIIRFKKGEAPTKKPKRREVFEPRNRDQRLGSAIVKPTFNLNHMLPSVLEGDEEDVQPRWRSNTYTQRTNN